jgi:hypothetical protein
MTDLTPSQVIGYWYQAGGSEKTAAMALARAYSESSLDSSVTSANPDGGTNVGLWQLDTPGGVGAGYTVPQLQDPLTNAKVTVKATNDGSNWSQWSDNYQAFLSQAQGDVEGYTGTTGPAAAGSSGGALGDVGGLFNDVTGLGSVVSAAQSLADDFEGLAKVLTWVSLPSNWVRIFAGIFGAASLGAGIYLIGKEAKGS